MGNLIEVATFVMMATVAIGPAPSRAGDLKDLARPLEKDQIFYRWQSTASGEGLARLGTLNASTNAHFMNVKDGVAAGSGLYFAGTPLSSSEYLPNLGGNLIEVKIPRGTMLLDLTDRMVAAELVSRDVAISSLHAGEHAADGLVLKYSNDWYVGKNLTDRAHFQIYPGPDQTDQDVLSTWRQARATKEPEVIAQFVKQVEHHRPDFIRRNFQPGNFEAPLMTSLHPHELVEVIKTHLNDDTAPHAMANLLEFLRVDPGAGQRIQRESPKAYNRIAQTLIPHYQGQLSHLTEADHEVITSLAVKASDNPAARYARRMGLILDGLSEPELASSVSAMSKIMIPLLNGAELTDQDRRLVADKLRTLLRRTGFAPYETVPLREMAKAAQVHDETFEAEIESFGRRARLITKAEDTGRSVDILNALRGHDSFDALRRTADRLANSTRKETVDSVLRHIADSHPDEYGGLIRTPRDLVLALKMTEDHGFKLFQANYAAALRADDVHRVKFIERCLDLKSCAVLLDEQITADRGRILRALARPEDLASVLSELNDVHPERAKRYATLIVRGLDDRARVQSFVRSVMPHPGTIAIQREADLRVKAIARLAERRRRAADACAAIVGTVAP